MVKEVFESDILLCIRGILFEWSRVSGDSYEDSVKDVDNDVCKGRDDTG